MGNHRLHPHSSHPGESTCSSRTEITEQFEFTSSITACVQQFALCQIIKETQICLEAMGRRLLAYLTGSVCKVVF